MTRIRRKDHARRVRAIVNLVHNEDKIKGASWRERKVFRNAPIPPKPIKKITDPTDI